MPSHWEAPAKRKQRFSRQKSDSPPFSANLQNKRFWLESEKRFVRLRISHKGMRIIDKVGLDKVVADMRAQGQRV